MGKVVTNVVFNAQHRFITWQVIGEETERYHINLKTVDDRAVDKIVYKNSTLDR